MSFASGTIRTGGSLAPVEWAPDRSWGFLWGSGGDRFTAFDFPVGVVLVSGAVSESKRYSDLPLGTVTLSAVRRNSRITYLDRP